MSAKFRMLRAMVRSLLERDLQRLQDGEGVEGWSAQGLGMLRKYIDDDRRFRLHVWYPGVRVPDVSELHTHPWDFTSLVIVGEICDHRYYNTSQADPGNVVYHCSQIQCGPNPKEPDKPMQDRRLWESQVHVQAGERYRQTSVQIHKTEAMPGTVTLIERKFQPDTEHALVFFAQGTKRVSAEPRPATRAELRAGLAQALDLYDWAA